MKTISYPFTATLKIHGTVRREDVEDSHSNDDAQEAIKAALQDIAFDDALNAADPSDAYTVDVTVDEPISLGEPTIADAESEAEA